MPRVSRTLWTALVIIGAASCASTAPMLRTSSSPEQAAMAFLSAFDRLEWEEFRGYLAEDMTMFFPFAQTLARVDGREGVESVFENFFRTQRRQRAELGGPMQQGLNPRDMKVQPAGADAAVVSFHLGSEQSPARRSLMLRRSGSQWKVIHWHASGIAAAAVASANASAVRSFVAAFNARDIDGMLALATDDVEWMMVDGAKVAVETSGKDALRKSMTAYFKSCVTCRSEVEIGTVTAGRVAAIETASWTAASGPRSQRSLSVYEFQGGRIRRVYYYPVEAAVLSPDAPRAGGL